MNWEAVGAVGEFLGALAVVASLVYLAMQVRQARQMFAANAQQQLGDAFQQLPRDIWSNPDVHRIGQIATTTPNELSDGDRERFGMLLISMFTEFSNVLQLSQIDPSIFEGFGPSMDRMLRFPAVRAWWSRQCDTFPRNSLIRRHIDSRLLEMESENANPMETA
jgi:hypothetical protein